MLDQKLFFDLVRNDPFPGSLSQSQVDGITQIVRAWARFFRQEDIRWLCYALATTMHETASTMEPIEEYGKGAGMSYGAVDPQTGQTYYGRGFVQLTWRDNYARADAEIPLIDEDSVEWHADYALDPPIAGHVMFVGMIQGWFRSGETLPRYFSDIEDDPYGAREIINGDKHIVPSWSHGVSIGNLIADYHRSFYAAFAAAWQSP
jgi:putative chitinase